MTQIKTFRNITPEIGDKFVINWAFIKKNYPKIRVCKFPDLEFTIHSFSRSGVSVYYSDLRTNIKCSCDYCSKILHGRNIPEGIKSIGVLDIIITQKKLAVERNLKLSNLGI